MSAEAFEKTLKFEGNSHNHLYWANLGDAYRQVKGQERPKAIEMLSLTIEAGYPLAEIMNDPELKNLRQDPAYHQLLSNKGTPL